MRIDIKAHSDNDSIADRMNKASSIRSKCFLIAKFKEMGIADHIITNISKVSPEDFPIYQNIHDTVEYEVFWIIVRMIRCGVNDEDILRYIPSGDKDTLKLIREYEKTHPCDDIDI